MREDSVAYRRCRHAVGRFLEGMNGFCCASRGAETVEDVSEVCSRAGSHLSGRTVLLKTNSQDVQQAHGAIILYIY